MTILELINQGKTQLYHCSGSALLDVELLLAHVLKKDREWLFSHPEKKLDANQESQFKMLLNQRVLGKPMAYILGEKEFWTLKLKVKPCTLIPRPETEELVETVLSLFDEKPRHVLDLGTGTGAIGLALAKERPKWCVVCTDCSFEVIELAKENAKKNEVSNVSFCVGNWYDALENKKIWFDIVVSNPPYICQDDPHLSQGDVAFEPTSALVSGADGLTSIHTIIANAHLYLKPSGCIFIEHSFDQGEAVADFLNQYGFSKIKTFTDLAELERFSSGKLDV